MEHKNTVRDKDTHFIIDAITRDVKNEPAKKTKLVQYDHNSERFTFECPRFIEEHDMSTCNKVEIHYLNIDAITREQNSGLYKVDDLQISEDKEKVTCSWLISRNATQLVGSLNFIIRFMCVEDDEIIYAWNTAIHTGITVTNGIDASEMFETEYADIIEQWKESVMQTFRADLTEWKERTTETLRQEIDESIDVERKRIDSIASLKDGSTTGDAELQDIRIGADGENYESAGTAVREQFVSANKKISALGEFEKDTSGWKKVNVIEGHSWGEAGRTYDDWGNLVSTEYTKQFTPLTELVHAVPSASYQFSGFVGQIRIYTSDKKQIDLLYNNAMSNQLSFVAPDNAHYFGIYYRHDILTTEEKVSEIKLFRTTMTKEEYRACPYVFLNSNISGENITEKSISKNKLDNDLAVLVNPLFGKTIINFGDSVFGNARPPEDISTFLSNITGAKVYNCGFGGCRMSYHPSENYDAFSMTKLADAVASHDFTVQEAAAVSTEGDRVPAYFRESVEILKNINFENVDIITIAYGTNDFNGIRLENENDAKDTRTFAGALRYSVEKILAAYPNIRIFICSPTYRFWMNEANEFVEDSDTKMGGAYYLVTDVAEKAKQVASEYKLPFVDNYHSLGINKFNRVHYFPESDGAHHNINGRELIARHIAKELF